MAPGGNPSGVFFVYSFMNNSRSGTRILVAVQVCCLLYIFLSGSFFPVTGPLLAFVILGSVPGIWALATMRLKNLQIFPEVKEGAPLLNAGPYRWVRHPMYTSVISVTLVLVIAAPEVTRVSCWGLLCLNMWLKMNIEETFLKEAFPAYAGYMERTKRLLPRMI